MNNLIRRSTSLLKTIGRSIPNRVITMTAPRCEKAMEELKSNPYFEKYAKKIATLQSTSPEEFLTRIETIVETKTKKKPVEESERNYASLLQPKKSLNPDVEEKDDPLDKIMKTELIRDKDADEIKTIWQEYHMQKEVIAASIPSKDYEVMMEFAKKHPVFILPLPRTQGYEFIMVQFQRNAVHFTPLICYQVHKENAPECLTMTHYTELKNEKGIILMRGEYDKNVITAKEAQCLANQLQMYYNGKDEEKLKIMETFTHKPDEFKHMDLIKEIENISLS